MCKVLFDHIVPHIVLKDKLLELLLCSSRNMGYCTYIEDVEDPYNERQYKNEFIPALIACIFLLDNPLFSQKIMNHMIYSVHLDITVGGLIRLSKKYIQAVYRNKRGL